MGVSGLNTFIKKHGDLILRDYSLRSNKKLIIDGHNVCHELFYAFQQKNRHFFGGDYDDFAKVCWDFFTALKLCDVTPYVIYDGAHDEQKFETMKSRAKDRIKTADKISRGQYGMVLPMMSYETFRDVVTRMGIHHVTCNFECDHQAAALAILWECPILSKDTDFLIYNVPAGVILWDFMDVKKFVREANTGKNRNPIVKIYKVVAVLNEARSSDPRILALWATLLGNDRVNNELFNTIFDKFELPSNCGNIKACDSKDRKVVGVLGWLSSMPTVDDALKTLPNHCSAKERPDIEPVIRKSMAAYTDLTCEVEGHFSDPTQLTGGGSLESFAGKQIPNRFMEGISNGKIPVHALDALMLRQVILPTQVSVTSEPSPYQCTVTLRQFLYSVLLLWDHESDPQQLVGSFIDEYDRDQNLQLNIDQVHALTHLESGRRVSSLDEIPLMTEPDRKSLLLDVLGVTLPQLDGFEPQTHLLMASIVHWMRNSRPYVGQLHLESLLVCFHQAGILGDRIRGNDDSIKGLRKTPDEISPRTFDCAVVHSFAQFQCCLQMALYVNQILLLPAPHPFPVLAFNGTFLHNFYRKLMELCCQQQRQQEQQMQLDEEQEGWQQQKQGRPHRQMRQPAQQQQTTPRQHWQQQQRHVWQGVISGNPNPLETACDDIAIYKDKLLSII